MISEALLFRLYSLVIRTIRCRPVGVLNRPSDAGPLMLDYCRTRYLFQTVRLEPYP